VEPARRKFSARLALVVFTLLGLGWLGRLDYGRKISTNVLDLIPPGEQSPEAGLVRSLAGDAQAQVMLFALRDSAAPAVPPVEAARQLAAELSRSAVFAEVVSLDDSSASAALGRAVFERRFSLLLPSWLGQRQREFAATGQAGGELFRLARRALGCRT